MHLFNMNNFKRLILFSLILFQTNVFSQQQNLEVDYKPLICSGEVPQYFKISTYDKLKVLTNLYKDDTEVLVRKKEKREVTNFLLHASYLVDQELLSGRVLFGDPITNYVNDIADKLLKDKPTIRKKLRFYTLRSSSVNAATTPDGTILINTGLIAYTQNEAQLAFIIAHEINHFTQKHSIEASVKKTSDKRKIEEMEFYKALDLYVYGRSRRDEFEADSLGLLTYLNAGYTNKEVNKTMDLLMRAYLPYQEKKWDREFLNNGHLKIPDCFYLEKLSEISPDEDEYDIYKTHPNIKKRKERVISILNHANTQNNDAEYLASSRSEFEKVRELARFDIIKSDLMRLDYGNAIYNSCILLDKYPYNIYLRSSVAKAFYGLAKYKIHDKFHLVARSFSKVEGESQQVHYLLRQFTTQQLAIVSFNQIYHQYLKEDKNEFYESLLQDLTRDIVLYTDINRSDFYKTPQEVESYNKRVDEKFKKELLKRGEISNRYRQNIEKNFYKTGMVEALKDEKIIQFFEEAEAEKRKLEAIAKLPYKQRMKIRSKEIELKKKQPKIYAKSVVVVSPRYRGDYKDPEDWSSEEDDKKEFIDIIKNTTKEEGIEYYLISDDRLTLSDVNYINKLAEAKEWSSETIIHDIDQIITVSGNFSKKDYSRASNLAVFISVNTNSESYFFAVFDIEKGKKLYSRVDTHVNTLSKIKSNLKEDFSTIKK